MRREGSWAAQTASCFAAASIEPRGTVFHQPPGLAHLWVEADAQAGRKSPSTVGVGREEGLPAS